MGEGHCYRFPHLQQALCSGGGDSPQHQHYPTLIDKCVGSFKSPDRTSRDKTNGLTSLSKDGVAKEGRPKFNPRPGRRLNPRPSGWQSEILPTMPTSHTGDHVNTTCGLNMKTRLRYGQTPSHFYYTAQPRGPCGRTAFISRKSLAKRNLKHFKGKI